MFAVSKQKYRRSTSTTPVDSTSLKERPSYVPRRARSWSIDSHASVLPVIVTDDCSMVVDTTIGDDTVPGPIGRRTRSALNAPGLREGKRKRKTAVYCSKHFAKENGNAKLKSRSTKKRKLEHDEIDTKENRSVRLKSESPFSDMPSTFHDKVSAFAKLHPTSSSPLLSTKPSHDEKLDVLGTTRQSANLDLTIANLSSDSDLSDPPSDIDDQVEPWHSPTTNSSPFSSSPSSLDTPTARKSKAKTRTEKKATSRNTYKSPYFAHAMKHSYAKSLSQSKTTLQNKSRPQFHPTLPFPPLSAAKFGLMQERLHAEPFRLLLATIFLNKTPGSRAIPVMFDLLEQYPGPEELADAEVADVTRIIACLGFQNQRARKIVAMAKCWIGVGEGVDKSCGRGPPTMGRRYRKVDYPRKRDGRDVKADEVLGDEADAETTRVIKTAVKSEDGGEVQQEAVVRDERIAWEISHLPGLGAYAHDSWRMFCRDMLRGLSTGYNGEGASGSDFEPEWKRVLPTDKELRAWMTWMWLKEGWVWDMETGKRTRASEELMALARQDGNVVVQQEGVGSTVETLHIEDAVIAKDSATGRATSALVKEKGSKRLRRVDRLAGGFVPEGGDANTEDGEEGKDDVHGGTG